MKSNQLKRINDVIQADKSVMSEGCKALMLQDLAEQDKDTQDSDLSHVVLCTNL